MGRVPRLSKSRFQAGLQCFKCLWLLCHAADLADEITEARRALFDQGHVVGTLARECFPDGVLVEEDHLHVSQALRVTDRLLSEGYSCLFEGAFQHDGVLVRTDIVTKEASQEWTLIEVKSSTEVKPEHITDLGIQAYVLRGAGLPVSGCRALHLDRRYVHRSGDHDPARLFTIVDVTAEVEQFLPAVRDLLVEMKDMLLGPMPDVQIGRRCERPYVCRFHGYCHGLLPESPVTGISRLSDVAQSSRACPMRKVL